MVLPCDISRYCYRPHLRPRAGFSIFSRFNTVGAESPHVLKGRAWRAQTPQRFLKVGHRHGLGGHFIHITRINAHHVGGQTGTGGCLLRAKYRIQAAGRAQSLVR